MRKPKEQLGGIQILEARDLNHAVQLVSQQPCFKFGLGPIEIRLVMDLTEIIKDSEQRRRRKASRSLVADVRLTTHFDSCCGGLGYRPIQEITVKILSALILFAILTLFPSLRFLQPLEYRRRHRPSRLSRSRRLRA